MVNDIKYQLINKLSFIQEKVLFQSKVFVKFRFRHKII